MDKFFYLIIFILLCNAASIFFELDLIAAEKLRRIRIKREKKNSFKKESILKARASALNIKFQSIVSHSQMPMAVYIVFSFLCGAVGFAAGRFIYSSLIISLAVGTFGLFAPMLYFSYKQTKAKSLRLDRLASSMMMLSNSYLATEDFITSVRENQGTLDYPEPFQAFLTYVTLMDSDVSIAFRRMESQVDNPYFSQWVDALILAQDDRSLKYVALSVVESFHDVLQVQKESDAAMYAVWRDYFLTLTLIFSVPFIFKILMPDVYITLTESFTGQALFVLLILTVFYSVVQALRINRPLMV